VKSRVDAALRRDTGNERRIGAQRSFARVQ
jgi:hypothetical protein